ncbi:(d)CMP kinase [Dysgonomonas sp. 25]|uniref:(d)CMP kinase n=1 Tax=Dysgonomonas sp. 25 TaxID=2302933 RepID=UPI0013D404C9|nr:(d)CMP kinase [Dysgonomonas sp. 25]NDV69582.1 (d)CMP kinase [Dysgonomonas sp. 25]
MKKITIAVDGFSSCGKSTMAKGLAHEIGYIYIDSGAMYRAVTYYCLQNGLFDDKVLDAAGLKKQLDNINISFRLNEETALPETYLNGVNVEQEIRNMDVSSRVSIVSAIPEVRHAMVALQQEMGRQKGIVMDGRDIGTVVFPDAELKIFVTADPKIRAERRLLELRSKGDEQTTFEEVLQNLKERDHLDQTRAESPLKQADDALVLDNSHLTRDEQMQWLVEQYNKVVDSL